MSNSCSENLPMRDNDSYRVNSSMDQNDRQCLSIPRQAETDSQVIQLWLHGRSQHTQRAYQKDVQDFLDSVSKPLHQITLGDLQQYSDRLQSKEMAPASCRRKLAAIKSMFGFIHRVGYLVFDVGKPLRIPACKDKLAERILTEEEVHAVIDSVKNKRDRLIIKTLYYTAIRVSELASLKWKDLQTRNEGGQLTILCKGGKTNTVLIPADLWIELHTLPSSVSDDNPVFMSRNGKHLHPGHVRRIVKNLALEIIGKGATPHYYRHSAASHAIANGCPLNLIQTQLNHSSLAVTGKYLHSMPSIGMAKYLK
jgi:integrase/recombinase XerD